MSEGLYIEKGPIIIIPDPLNPNFFQIVRNSEWTQIPEICSFTDFIHWNYAEDYEATIRNCVENGLVPLGNQSEYRREQIASIKLDHTQIHRIYLHHIDNVSFRMDVVMIANFTVHFYGNSFVKEKQWYRVQGTFRICDKSNFFESVSVYNKDDIPQKRPLSEYLVPYLSKNELDTAAMEMLHEYYPEALENPMKLNVRQLAENMGFQVRVARLSPDDSKLGSIYFEDTQIKYYKGGQIRKATVKANTILVDMQAHENRNRNTNDTVVHECVHAYLHYLFYYLQSLYHSFLNQNAPEFEDVAVGKSEDDPIRWVEYQAIHMTPRVRMPLNQTTVKAEELFIRYRNYPEPIAFEHVIADLADFYDVSRIAARNRLVELGYDKAKGIGHFANGKPVPGYLVGTNVHYNQIYTIDFAKVIEEYQRNAEFRTVLDKGAYLYVEGHLCLNNDKYIWYQNGQPCLSSYARTHMDECCLMFTVRHERQNYEYVSGVLNRRSETWGVKAYLYNMECKMPIDEAVAGHQIFEGIPETFGETLIYHMDNLAITKEQLSELSLISSRTIARMRNTKKRMPAIESIIAASIGMSLYPELSYDLLEKADRHFDPDIPVHSWYRVMLRTMYRESIYKCNELLEQHGFRPLKEDTLAAAVGE